MLWYRQTLEDKLQLVRRLQELRLDLAKQAKTRRRSASTSSKKKKALTNFASDEHKRVYESLPPEARKLLFGA